MQVIVDGSDPNTAGLVQGYVQGVWQNWLVQEAASKAGLVDRPAAGRSSRPSRAYWFNPNLDSRDSLLPGAVAIILT